VDCNKAEIYDNIFLYKLQETHKPEILPSGTIM
jgi:hypothetical protein